MDRLTADQRSANMRQIKSKGMKPELAVRRLVHSLGYRYRLHREDLPGKPDLVFVHRRKVIFVHGCFWHQHSKPNCRYAHTPRSNSDYWGPKLARNVERDKRSRQLLAKEGWKAATVWECELKNLPAVSKKLQKFLG